MFVRINSDDEDDNEDRFADSKAEFVEDEPILLALLDINDILTPSMIYEAPSWSGKRRNVWAFDILEPRKRAGLLWDEGLLSMVISA